MSKREGFERIVASLHDAALDPAHWLDASALIDAWLRTHGSTLIFGSGHADNDARVHFAWTCMRGQRHRELERLYFETYYPLDERIPRVRTLPHGRIAHNSDVYTAAELRTSAAYNAVRSFAHGGDGINVRLDGPGGSHIYWFVHDPVNGQAWSSAQLAGIRRLLPHIRQTVRVQQALADASALCATHAELLDATGLGVVQLDARGRIVAANDRAGEVLRIGDGLFDSGGYLFSNALRDNDDLQALLANALPRFGEQGASGSMMLRRQNARLPLVLHVNPVHRAGADHWSWPVAVLVLVADPAHGTSTDPAVIAAVLGFTAAESRVAEMLARSLSVREIADATRCAESTVRSHIKSMFNKHNLSRQSQLVRLVQSVGASPRARKQGV